MFAAMKKTTMPTPEEALPGREMSMPVSGNCPASIPRQSVMPGVIHPTLHMKKFAAA